MAEDCFKVSYIGGKGWDFFPYCVGRKRKEKKKLRGRNQALNTPLCLRTSECVHNM